MRLCKAHGVVTALDNTWGAGIAFSGFDLGIDIVMQALTKFPSGGGDVLMGSVTTRDEALHERIKLTHMRLGLYAPRRRERSTPIDPSRAERVSCRWFAQLVSLLRPGLVAFCAFSSSVARNCPMAGSSARSISSTVATCMTAGNASLDDWLRFT